MKEEISQMPRDYHLRERLGFRLSRAARMMQERLEEGLAEHGLTRLKWCILSGVELEGHIAPSDLADHVGVARPVISRILKVMTKDGLITRTLSEDDGRGRRIEVTDLGREKIKLCWPMVERNQQHFAVKLDPHQMAVFDELLRTLMEGEDGHLGAL